MVNLCLLNESFLLRQLPAREPSGVFREFPQPLFPQTTMAPKPKTMAMAALVRRAAAISRSELATSGIARPLAAAPAIGQQRSATLTTLTSPGRPSLQRRTQATAAATASNSASPAPSPVFSVDASKAHDSSESGPLPLLDKLVKSGTFRSDERQRELTGVLQELHEELMEYEPEEPKAEEAPALFSRVGVFLLLLRGGEDHR